MKNIIEVVEAKIEEYENQLEYIRSEEAKMLERKGVIICKIGALERELKEFKEAPKKRVRTPTPKTEVSVVLKNLNDQ